MSYTIQTHAQAARNGMTVNIGGGLDDAIEFVSNHRRYSARLTILFMTDGNANERDSNWSPFGRVELETVDG